MAEVEEKQEGQGSQFREALSEMPMNRKLMVMVAAALLVGGMVALFLWVNQPEYQVLYSGLGQRDAAAVVAKLKELKVPYQLDGGGAVIKVPRDQVYETRLDMASNGLPRGGGIGYEVFNEVKMGTTEFVQKVNYQRALEGELARTIASFSEVEEARVHIVMPRESLFVEDEKKPTAAVVLRLAAGRALSQNQIQGVVHLVASSVPDLSDQGVTVVDNQGNLLYRSQADTGDFPGAMTASQLEYQRKVEASLKNKVQSMLEQVVGMGKAVVRVSADIDFTRTSEVQDVFNPDQVAVRSETRTNENNKNAGPMPVGSPDQRFTLAARNAAAGLGGEEGKTASNRENETTNYEISRTKRQLAKAIAGLQRLSVAVVVDGPYTTQAPAKGGGQPARTFTPRTAEQMRQLTELVRRAVGYNEKRGDLVTVANVPFALPATTGVVGTKSWEDYLHEYGRPVLNIILAILFFIFVVRPLIRYLMTRTRTTGAMVPAGAGAGVGAAGPARRVGPGEELAPGVEREMEPDMLETLVGAPRKTTNRDVILALSQQDPEKTTAVLRSWIHEI